MVVVCKTFGLKMPCLEQVVMECVIRAGGIRDGDGVEVDGTGNEEVGTVGTGDALEDVGKWE